MFLRLWQQIHDPKNSTEHPKSLRRPHLCSVSWSAPRTKDAELSPQALELSSDDNNEGYRTSNVPVPCCSFAQWLWSTGPAVTALGCFPWPVAWNPPRGEPLAQGKALSKTQSQCPSCPTAKSSADIPPETFVMGAPQHPWV